MIQNFSNISYNEQLLKNFSSIFYKNQDIMQNMSSILPSPNQNRQQILFTQYPMQKKGKNFGTVQQRTFRIDDQKLKQIDKNGQQRDLPYPSSITKQYITQYIKNQWGFVQYNYRLLLQFTQRNPIYIYLKTKQQLMQIYAFICSKIHPQQIDILKESYENFYKMKLMNYLINKLSNVNVSKKYGSNKQSRRINVVSRLKSQYTDINILRKFVMEWHRKAIMTSQDPQKIAQNQRNNTLNVKNIVSQLTISFEHIKNISQFAIKSGQLKLWVGQKTYQKTIKINQQQKLSQQYHTIPSKIDINKINPFSLVTIFNLKNNQIKLRNQNPPLSIWTTLQFQVQTKNQNNNIISWRSQRFYIIDLIKSLVGGNKKTVTLWSGKLFIQLFITITSVKCQAIKIQLPPQHQSFPSSYTYNLTPNHHPILRQLLPAALLKKYIKSFNTQTIHLQYTIAYQQYLQTQSIQSLTFNSFHKLYDILQIDSIIDKFYSTQPYSKYINIQHKGTFIYQQLVKTSDKFTYYDAQKFIWKYQCAPLRRFLSVIKAFDQFPRINYNQQFYYLCLQCIRLAQKQSLIKWKHHNFANTLLGRQSLAFFMILGIIKSNSQLLLYQNNHNVLASNTLLFHYVLKKYSKSLYNKYLAIQFNIQAYFGTSIASMLANLFNNPNVNSYRNYNGNQEVFIFIIISYLLQRRQQAQKAKQQIPDSNNKTKQLQNIRNIHYTSLIAMFLAIIQLFDIIVSSTADQKISINKKNKNKTNDNNYIDNGGDDGYDNIVGNSCAYSSANTFLSYLNIFACTKLQLYMPQLIILHHKYSVFCYNQLSIQKQYILLQQNLQQFHIQNNPSIAYNNNNNTSNVLSSNKQIPLNNNNNTNNNIVNNVNNMGIGQLMQQMYSQFMCYKYKNQADIRKICIIIDHIYLGDIITQSNTNNNINTSSSSYRPPSLLIQLIQNNIKIYQHQYILPPSTISMLSLSTSLKNDNTNSQMLALQNMKHTIQLKLSKLSIITLIVTNVNINAGSNNSNQSYATTIDPTQISSNYYIQLIKQLNPITYYSNNANNTSILQQKTNELYRNCQISLQIYIKDSCQVDYIENTVPNLYINLLLLKDRINQHAQDYRKDIIFCNQYFKTFRLTQNNFNLLYAKLGWYGNHYLIPADRILRSYIVIPNSFAIANNNTNNSTLNNTQVISSLSQSYPQLNIKSIPKSHLQRINQILFYTRCVFGRGLLPNITYTSYGHGYNMSSNSNLYTQIIVESVRGNNMLIKQCKNIKNQINQYQYNSCGNLVVYPLQNFNTINCYSNNKNIQSNNTNGNFFNQGNKNSFVQFYMRSIQQLPMIRYLCFRPLQFYLLQQMKLILKVPIPTTQPINKNYTSNNPYSQQSNKQHAVSTSQYTSVNNNSSISCRKYQIILTNHPILINSNKTMNKQNNLQLFPYKFVSNPSQLEYPDLYQNYQTIDNMNIANSNNNENDLGWGRCLYNNLFHNIQLPSTMYFTYPEGISHNTKNQQLQNTIDGLSGSGCREMLINQFLFLLKYNIYKYYIKQKNKNKPNTNNNINPLDKKQKNKNLRILDCQFQLTDSLIPNTRIAQFFQFILQTKHKIQLIASPITPIIFTQLSISTSSKSSYSLHLYPIILNPIYRHYTSYTFLGGIWVPVCILAKFITPNFQIYYVEQKISRRYRVVKNNDTILGIQGKRILERLPMFKFTDYEIINGKECVRKQLVRIL